jgi:hypothetical protein
MPNCGISRGKLKRLKKETMENIDKYRVGRKSKIK